MKTNTEISDEIEDSNSKEELEGILNRISEKGIDINRFSMATSSIVYRISWNFIHDHMNTATELWKLSTLLEHGANPLLTTVRPVIHIFADTNIRRSNFPILSLLCEYGGGLIIRIQSKKGTKLFGDLLFRGATYKTHEEMSHKIEVRFNKKNNLRLKMVKYEVSNPKINARMTDYYKALTELETKLHAEEIQEELIQGNLSGKCKSNMKDLNYF